MTQPDFTDRQLQILAAVEKIQEGERLLAEGRATFADLTSVTGGVLLPASYDSDAGAALLQNLPALPAWAASHSSTETIEKLQAAITKLLAKDVWMTTSRLMTTLKKLGVKTGFNTLRQALSDLHAKRIIRSVTKMGSPHLKRQPNRRIDCWLLAKAT